MSGYPLISAWPEVAGTEAGLGEQVLLAVITAAERVGADTAARLAQHARREPPAGVIRGRAGRHFLRQPPGSGESGQVE